MPTKSITMSGRGVIDVGESGTEVKISLPKCPRGKKFLFQGVHVAPEVCIGNTSKDVINLPRWAVSVPTYQVWPTGQIQVAFTVLSEGTQHVSAVLPAGQSIGPIADSIPVRIALLGGVTATHRFEFNIHLTGVCGTPFTCPK